MKKIIIPVIILVIIIAGAIGWFILNKDSKTYGQFSETQTLDVEPMLVEEDGNLYVQWETEEPIEDSWVNAGYNNNLYAGTKVYNHETSGAYYNKELNSLFQHRVLASWAMKEEKDVIQFQIVDDNKNYSKIYILDFNNKIIKYIPSDINQKYLDDPLYCEDYKDCSTISKGECCDFDIVNEYYRGANYGIENKGTWTCEEVCPLTSGEIIIICENNRCISEDIGESTRYIKINKKTIQKICNTSDAGCVKEKDIQFSNDNKYIEIYTFTSCNAKLSINNIEEDKIGEATKEIQIKLKEIIDPESQCQDDLQKITLELEGAIDSSKVKVYQYQDSFNNARQIYP